MRSELRHHRAAPPRRKPLVAALLAALAGSSASAAADGRLPLPQPSAVFATLGRASYSASGVQGLVKQIDDRVILNWDSFDIAAGHKLRFEQPAATSLALNRINERTRQARSWASCRRTVRSISTTRTASSSARARESTPTRWWRRPWPSPTT